MKTLVISPAYGRDYTTASQVMAAWHDGKDFMIQSLRYGGTYVSIRDAKALVADGYVAVELRYMKKTKLTVCSLEA